MKHRTLTGFIQQLPGIAGLVLAAALSPSALAEEGEWSGRARDAWIDGKLEGAYLLNTELNNFKISTKVENGRVQLSGTVETEAHKQLAEHIASNIEGVEAVENNLTIGESDYSLEEGRREFVSRFHDMTITAALKSEFAINQSVDALEIDIDTEEGVVTLDGEVGSEAARQLAGEIARSYERVREVRNNLRVAPEEGVNDEAL